jgi:type IV secretory pathway VirD2 relaxase
MADEEDRFEPRLGRPAKGRGRAGRARSLQSQLIGRIARVGGDWRSASLPFGPPRQTGRFNARGRGSKLSRVGAGSFGWSVDRISGMRVRARRVIVKARVVKLAGAKAFDAAVAHLRYVQRDGVTRAGEHGRFYSTFSDDVDGKAFLERGAGDRHQFRLIVSPEDGASFDTLKSFTRELVAKMEQDLGTTLDWVAVDHFDTGHPHTHLLVRGATEDGKVLNIAGDYIACGIRGRASEIMTRWLGPQSELEVREQLSQEIGAERLTKLDRDILSRAEDHFVDLRQPARWDGDGSYQQLLIGRARELERMGLAEREGPLTWSLAPAMAETLTDLGRRGDIIRTMHLAMTRAKLDRRPELYVVDRTEADSPPVVGKVIDRGTTGDHHDRYYVVIDGIDGRTHYLETGSNPDEASIGSVVRAEPTRPMLRKVDGNIVEIARTANSYYSADLHHAHDRSASSDYVEAHIRRLEAMRRDGLAVERQSDGSWRIPSDYLEQALGFEQRAAKAVRVKLQLLAVQDLDRESMANAPSWLDRQLRGDDATEVANHGYGAEVRHAMVRRQQWLIEQGLAEQQGEQVLYRGDMDQRLRRAEIKMATARLSKELGLNFSGEPVPGERIAGIVRRRINLNSGSFAIVENSREFTLVPWRAALERQRGREISGVMRSSGSISWTFGRQRRGPEISM